MHSIKLFALAPCPGLCLAALSHGAVVYEHGFGGSSGDSLNGVKPDVAPNSTVAWTSNTGIRADGSVTTGNTSAWLPYSFGSGVYEVKLTLQFVSTSGTGYGAISFTTADPFDTGALSTVNVAAYATFGIRANRDFEFWGGAGSANNIDGGALPAAVSGNGTLRLVLNTTSSAWTVDAFFTPNDSDTEFTIDLNPLDAGSTTYTFGANQPASSFTGVGIIQGTVNVKFDQFTFTVVPEPSSMALIALGAAPLALRRRRQSI